MTSKKKRKLIASLAVVLVAIMTIGATYMYFTDVDEVTNKFVVGDLDIEVEEPGWIDPDPTDPKYPEDENVPGDVKDKDPSVELIDGVGAYTRFIVSFVDTESGDVITDADRIALIEGTIFYDPSNILKTPKDDRKPDAYGDAAYDINAAGYTYKKDDLAKLLADGDIYKYNTLLADPDMHGFVRDVAGVNSASPTGALRESAGVYYFNYVNKKTGDHANVLEQADGKIELFTKIVIPADYNNYDMQKLGKYSIVIKAEAIQDEGFASSAEAFNQLDVEALPRVNPNP